MTPLAVAQAAMEAAPGDEALRRAFFARLAETELFLLLEDAAAGDRIEPVSVSTEAGTCVLAFDGDDRLAAHAGTAAPYAALPGRTLAAMLAAEGMGLVLNAVGDRPGTLVPPDALAWIAGAGAEAPRPHAARVTGIAAPAPLPETVLRALDSRLARAAGLAETAFLVSATLGEGGPGHLLGIVGAEPQAEPALAAAISEALAISGADTERFDIGFFAPNSEMAARLSRQGLRFDLPPAPAPMRESPAAPGMDPEKPPRLR